MLTARIARHQSLPHCNACGYDMNARPAGDPCPECGTPFDPRPDAPGSRTRSMTVLICLWAALVLMPFLALLSLILWFAAYASELGIRWSGAEHRLSYRVRRRLRTARWLWWTNAAAFWLLMLIFFIWPDALNWW
jgi:hypothetical protein